MLWSGWGDPAKAARPARTAPQAAPGHARRTRPGDARPRASARCGWPPSRCRRSFSPSCAASSATDHVRSDDDARIRHTRGKSTPDLMRMRAGDGSDAPDAVVLPGSPRRGDGAARGSAPPTGSRSFRSAAAPRSSAAWSPPGAASPGSSRWTWPAEPAGLGGHRVDDRRRWNRACARPQAERLLAEPRAHPGPLPAVLRVRHARRLRRRALQRPGLGGIRPLRRHGRRDDRGHPARHPGPRPRAQVGGRARPAPARPRLRGRLRRDHLAAPAGPARRPPSGCTRGGGSRRSRRAGRAARVWPRRARADRAAPVRRDRDDDRAGQARRARRPGGRRGLPGDRGLRGLRGGRRARGSGPPPCCRGLGGVHLGTEPGESWAHGRYSAPYLRDSLLAVGSDRRDAGDGGVLVRTCPGSTTPYGSRCTPRSARRW